jgi:ORF6N domain
MMASTRSVTVDTDAIVRNILVMRSRRVLLDSDVAALYQVATKALTRAVRRNPGRFPADFMFQLAVEESASLRSQSGALKTGRGKHRKYAPYVFTEQGIAMLSSVLTSERAVQVNIEIMRAFIRLRQAVSTHEDLAHKLVALENKYDRQFKVVFDARAQASGNRFHGKDQRIGIAGEIPFPPIGVLPEPSATRFLRFVGNSLAL